MIAEGMRVALDPGLRRVEGGTVMLGGAPPRMLRVSAAGAALVDRLAAGGTVSPGCGAAALVRRMLDSGMAHPRPGGAVGAPTIEDVAVVIPVRGSTDEVVTTVASLGPAGQVIVVDDGSTPPIDGAALRGFTDSRLRVIRHDVSLGPAAARETGWRATADATVVVFVDAEVVASPGWLVALLAHLADQAVVAVAPRILARPASSGGDGESRGGTAGEVSVVRHSQAADPAAASPSASALDEHGRRHGEDRTGLDRRAPAEDPGADTSGGGRDVRTTRSGLGWAIRGGRPSGRSRVSAADPPPARSERCLQRWLETYDAARSPLDMGPAEANVRPGSPVGYVPTATLVVRRTGLEVIDGFDTSLRYGEDVDLVWRLAASGGTIRYEPAVVMTHPVRSDLRSWVMQRVGYGSSAGPLAVRHASAVAPVSLTGWTAATWGAVALGHPLIGGTVGLASTAALVRRLRGGGRLLTLSPTDREAMVLAVKGHRWTAEALARAARRTWLPIAAGALLWPRTRIPVAAGLIAPSVLDLARGRGGAGVVLGALDDVAYCAGVWRGSWRSRTVGALLPARAGSIKPGTKD